MSAAPSLRGEPRFTAGQPVRVDRGSIAGLTGLFVKNLDPSRTLVKLDGMGDGVYLSLPENWLEAVSDSGEE